MFVCSGSVTMKGHWQREDTRTLRYGVPVTYTAKVNRFAAIAPKVAHRREKARSVAPILTSSAQASLTSVPPAHRHNSEVATSCQHHDRRRCLHSQMGDQAFHSTSLFTYPDSPSTFNFFVPFCTSTTAIHTIAFPVSLLDTRLGLPHSFGNTLRRAARCLSQTLSPA